MAARKFEGETDIERRKRLAIEQLCAEIGHELATACAVSRTGFALMMFDFGEKGSFSYASNANREDFIKLLKEALGKLQGEG